MTSPFVYDFGYPWSLTWIHVIPLVLGPAAAAVAIQTLPAGVVHSCTDVTGFGLAGHGTEMARASGVTLTIEVDKLPRFDGVMAIAAQTK